MPRKKDDPDEEEVVRPPYEMDPDDLNTLNYGKKINGGNQMKSTPEEKCSHEFYEVPKKKDVPVKCAKCGVMIDDSPSLEAQVAEYHEANQKRHFDSTIIQPRRWKMKSKIKDHYLVYAVVTEKDFKKFVKSKAKRKFLACVEIKK